MKTENHLYKRVKEDSRYIAEIATQLEFLSTLQEQGVTQTDKINPSYEDRRKRDIKNALTNIYLVLELHEVKGVADHIYNSDFKPEE